MNMEIKTIKDYYQQVYTNQLGNLNEMENFLEVKKTKSEQTYNQ